MKLKPQEVERLGEVIKPEGLRIRKAKQFAEYLGHAGGQAFTKLLQVHRGKELPSEVVVFSVVVERPQTLVHPIQREEMLAAIFLEADEIPPEVISLRPDFPCVPHTNLRSKGYPISLCLYDQPYDVVKLTWTPSEFLQRIHFWLARTATGTLHGADQPLEPLMAVLASWTRYRSRMPSQSINRRARNFRPW